MSLLPRRGQRVHSNFGASSYCVGKGGAMRVELMRGRPDQVFTGGRIWVSTKRCQGALQGRGMTMSHVLVHLQQRQLGYDRKMTG